MSFINQFVLGCLLFALPFVAGCSGPPDATVAATGTVNLDGKPIEGVTISLVPQAGVQGVGGYGISDVEGKFVLKSGPEATGVMPGTYRVLFQKMRQKDGSPIPPDAMEADFEVVNHLPPVYAHPDHTPVSFVIPTPDGQPLAVDLKSR